jgi:hypothetical protein
MADISIQFHALPQELLPFVQQCVADFDLYIVAMRFFPFEAIEVRPDDLESVFSESSPYRELGFTLHKPTIPVKSNTDYVDKNPDSLRIDIQRTSKEGLRQTWLTARTDNVEALAVWRKIGKRLKEMTQAGVIAVNPDTGATALSRTFRYTAGAKALESSGVLMLPAAGGCILKLGVTEGGVTPGRTHLTFPTLRLLFEDFLQERDIQGRFVAFGPHTPLAWMPLQ